MSSSKDQRAAARARLEREMALRAEAARRRRKLQASIAGGVAVLLVAVGTVSLVLALRDDDKDTKQSATPACTWLDVPAGQANQQTVDVGTPPTDPPRTGTTNMTINTNFGAIEVDIDRAKVPCTAASMEYLANQGFFDGTKCHRMFDGVLQCGDPSARGEGYRETDGTGGPAYRYGSENLPGDKQPPYPTGVVAMANNGQPDSTGSQFFIVYKDQYLPPDYTILGTVTKGLDVVEEATKAGLTPFTEGGIDGNPKSDIILESVRVGGSASPSASATATPSPAPSS